MIIKTGRGCKAIIEAQDKESIPTAVKANRQRMRTTKAKWETESSKKVCDSAFKAFLKTLANDINA